MKLNIKIDKNDIKKIKSNSIGANKINSIKDELLEAHFPGLSLDIEGIDLIGNNLREGDDIALEKLLYDKVNDCINKKPGILWCNTKIDGVKHCIGYAKNGIRYSAAKFLNHSEKQDKYIVVRMEPVIKSLLTLETDRYATFLSADVKKYISSNSLANDFKDKKIDYKVHSYDQWERRTVLADIVNSDAMHNHMRDNKFNIFSMCAYENLEDVKNACVKDVENIFNPREITWREFISGPTGSFITGEIEFLSKKKPMYMLNIEDDNSFKVELVKSDYETVIKTLNLSEKDGKTALQLCESDLQNSMAKNNEISK